MKHHFEVQVRWGDLDAFGHINNASYLIFIQEARVDFTALSREKRGEQAILMDMVVARAEIDYLEPIYDGLILVDVAISVERLGTSSFVLNYEISHSGILHAKAKTVQVTVDMNTKKSRPLYEHERAFLAQYLND